VPVGPRVPAIDRQRIHSRPCRGTEHWRDRQHNAHTEQTLIGSFWGGKIQNYWNEITQTAAIAHNLNLEQSARVFALVNFGMADATISFFEAKYIYHFWRPVTPAELTDSDWLPLPKPRRIPPIPVLTVLPAAPPQQYWRFILETNSPSMSRPRSCRESRATSPASPVLSAKQV
jgi:hypothetical protein